jgi:hypothetical protein
MTNIVVQMAHHASRVQQAKFVLVEHARHNAHQEPVIKAVPALVVQVTHYPVELQAVRVISVRL